jgi:hypothetical protein
MVENSLFCSQGFYGIGHKEIDVENNKELARHVQWKLEIFSCTGCSTPSRSETTVLLKRRNFGSTTQKGPI